MYIFIQLKLKTVYDVQCISKTTLSSCCTQTENQLISAYVNKAFGCRADGDAVCRKGERNTESEKEIFCMQK